MEAGRLNKRITIQRREKTRNPSGQTVGEWKDGCTVWAEANCADSKALDANGAVQHEGLYRFYIRWRPGITAEMRVVWQGRIFLLGGPPADWKGEKAGLTLLAKELV